MNYQQIIKNFPKRRTDLPPEYSAIYDQHYEENRNGTTKVSSLSQKMESWLHKKVAATNYPGARTLEIGAGTLNQLNYEHAGIYDIVEPYTSLFENSPHKCRIRNIYNDISDVPALSVYDRITSVACFEHVCDLPDVVKKCAQLLAPNGILSVSIPNEGRFLWKLAYTMTTGREFKKRFGLNYETLMRYEHVNTADEIEIILKHYFNDVHCSLFGIGKDFSFYRHYKCTLPVGKYIG